MEWNLAKLHCVLASEPDLQVHVQNLEASLSKNLGPRNCIFWKIFLAFFDLIAIIIGTKHDTDNRKMIFHILKVPYVLQKFHKFMVHQWLECNLQLYSLCEFPMFAVQVAYGGAT